MQYPEGMYALIYTIRLILLLKFQRPFFPELAGDSTY